MRYFKMAWRIENGHQCTVRKKTSPGQPGDMTVDDVRAAPQIVGMHRQPVGVDGYFERFHYTPSEERLQVIGIMPVIRKAGRKISLF